MVGALEAFLDDAPPAASAAAATFASEARRFVDFFRLYTDTLHHGKEEDVLFEALVEEGMPLESGPIAAMLEEHQVGRALVRQMAQALDHLSAGTATASREIERAGRAYIDLLRQHIEKEDDGVFEMADRALDEPGCRKVCDAYDEVCARRFAGRTMAQLEQLGRELVERHAG